MFTSLDVLGHKRYLSEKVICNYALESWWDLRFSPGRRPIYLAFPDIHVLSANICSGTYVPSKTFKTGIFQALYRATAPKPKHRMVSFFLQRSQSALVQGSNAGLSQANHFFPVVFDYQTHKAYFFGVISAKTPDVRVEGARSSGWASWMGPQLWGAIAHELGWRETVRGSESVTVVTKNWPQVCGIRPHRCKLTNLHRTAMTVECTHWTFSRGWPGLTNRSSFWTTSQRCPFRLVSIRRGLQFWLGPCNGSSLLWT